MIKRMLIDATHPEETRVVVLNGTRLEELDVETSTKKQLKGNVYLAKIVRVEPSLQAAFVDYGGNRHGFLAFNEIHPDYYQIPVSDRKRLIAEQKRADADHREDGDERSVDTFGGDDADEVDVRPRVRPGRDYKIQEVIKRRQILLVQVVKEERGNKGAALTTYLSLAGRYCVLMPNTGRGGGVSRKITSITDRKRLKSMLNEFAIPEGMAVILRTAGAERAKAEIRRDYEYLMRTWNQIRDITMRSRAPALIHEEANLIKRAIRDIYSRDIDEVIVDGDEGYRLAKDFMKTLTPSHAKKVQPYKDVGMPLFHRYQVAAQLDAMHSPIVQLRSGGYVVFSQTEALVAIDVNSGKATRERHIEETALKTNLEAAEEVARQLRLRDLAGLIVIDFIDMEESKNNQAVERRMKEAMRSDRARIQMGRISPFGLLELSRQRLRPSLMETSFEPCAHCGGVGVVRSVESTAVHVLRAIEEEGVRHRSSEIVVTTPTPVALYILNQKRATLAEIEQRYSFHVIMSGDDKLITPNYRIERTKPLRDDEIEAVAALPPIAEMPAPLPIEPDDDEDEVADDEEPQVSTRTEQPPAASQGEDGAGGDEAGRKRRRRRRRRGRRGGTDQAEGATGAEMDGDEGEQAGDSDESGDAHSARAEDGNNDDSAAPGEDSGEDADGARRSRRRGKRGGRKRRRGGETDAVTEAMDPAEIAGTAGAMAFAMETDQAEAAADADSDGEDAAADADETASDEPAPKRRTARRAKAPEADEGADAPKKRRATRSRSAKATEPAPELERDQEGEQEPEPRQAREPEREQAEEQAPEQEQPAPQAWQPDESTAPVESVTDAEPAEHNLAHEQAEEPVPAESTSSEEGQPEPEAAPGPRRGGWWQKAVP